MATVAATRSPVSPAFPRPSTAAARESILSQAKVERSSRHSDEDTKTSVRVAIRIRPALKPTDPGYDLIPQRFQRSMVQNTSISSLAVDSPQGKKHFIFDKVFGSDVNQEGIFEYIAPGVDAFLQGYNVTIMAYGQSGAGKSYTMGTSGPSEQDDRQLMGIVPRAAIALFAQLTGRPQSRASNSGLKAPQKYSLSLAPGALANGKPAPTDRDWQLKATYVEIHNEQLRDLLIPADTPPDMRPVPTIREDKGKILLTNVTQVDVNSAEDLFNALNYGSTIRQTDATAINARSSRSHAIFSLNLVQKGPRSPDPTDRRRSSATAAADVPLPPELITTDSKLHFVDLAGSERLKNTGASGERAKEGIAINASLTSLGKVISQLSSRHQGAHVSYRDFKLTRLLSDSLGGNALTYLVACVTPAEFHLSETLNTVQYAQRARAIQSKPLIQSVNDEGNKQAVIDRLRAEIAFLRTQIKSAQSSSDRTGSTERSDVETELQEQLLSIQESYSTLSKRHASLIAEVSKAGKQADNEEAISALGATPAERIERANNMSKVIDQVVREYEETVATLQGQLRSQKSTLDTTENRVLEQESKLAFVEKVNGQLQQRAQKFIDRESSLESYVRDLESRLDGRMNTDDRNTELLSELRKQLNKMRDQESASEEYISGLEESLAEAQQDMELMNREINKLENVVERQRSVGRLDSLLMELNNIQKKGEAAAAREMLVNTTNGTLPKKADQAADAWDMPKDANSVPLPESVDGDSVAASENRKPSLTVDAIQVNGDSTAHSPSQMQFVEEKLDSVNQELITLRVEHETTLNEYDSLAEKYEGALRALAAMRRNADPEAADSALPDARVGELRKEGEQMPSPRTSGMTSTTANEDDQTEVGYYEGNVRDTPATSISSVPVRPQSDLSETAMSRSQSQQVIGKEVEELKIISQQKDTFIEQLSNELEDMRAEHDKALETVASLKGEVQRAKAGSPASPTNFVRRKSGHNALGTDRTNRAFVSLGNIAADHLEDKPDARENFQLQINALSNEMQSRSDRIEALELEITNSKKEMEAKMQIISGLARERSSMIAASPIDVSVVSTMRDQLVQNENHIKALQDQLGVQEKKLGKEIRRLKAELADAEGRPRDSSDLGPISGDDKDMRDLESVKLEEQRLDEVDALKSEIDRLKTSEKSLVMTIAELEDTLSSVDSLRQEKTAEAAAASAALADEQQKLADELIQQKTTIEAHAARYDALQLAYESLQRELNEHSGLSEASVAQLENHRNQIDQLEVHLQSQYDAIEEYKETIEDMAKHHGRELEEMQAILQQHDLEASRDIPEGEAGNYELRNRLAASEAARSRAESTLDDIQIKVETLSGLERQLKEENEHLRQREQRSSRLVQDLETQLNYSLGDSRRSSGRLSTARQNGQQELAEARAAVVKAQEQVAELQARLQQFENSGTPATHEFPERANSLASRKSIGLASLPSPPPAIPLPPLPANVPPSPMVASFAGADGRPKSPPTSLLAKRDSASQQATMAEQEARIRTVEKHLTAEKQLTQTLEEALTDLETQGEKVKKEAEGWRKRAQQVEAELEQVKSERSARQRDSQNLLETERMRRLQADEARAKLEDKMALINKKKKKSNLNCF